jgi:prevent-host-death family protein
MTYTVAEAKNKLPELIRRAESGARVTITKRGIPVVEIVRKVNRRSLSAFSACWERRRS